VRFALSTDGGATWGLSNIVKSDEVFFDLNLGLASDNRGFVTWSKGNPETGARDFIQLASTDPIPDPVVTPPPTTPPPSYVGTTYSGPSSSFSGSVKGAKITFGVPRNCVQPGQMFRVRLTWKKQRRKGNLFVKVRRADFYIGTKRVKVDKKAPFTQVLTVTASTVRGTTVRLRARAFIKVKRGKSPTKSIRASIKVCS
jgi:hypothetical protein